MESYNRRVRVAAPNQGRLYEFALDALRDAFDLDLDPGRRLLVESGQLELVFARSEDIPKLLNEGAIDLGVTGADYLGENNFDGRWAPLSRFSDSMCLLVPSDASDPFELNGKRVVSQYPNTARALFQARRLDVTVRAVSGAAEVYPRLGLADAVIDIVSSGVTARANDLRILERLFNTGPAIAIAVDASSAAESVWSTMIAALERRSERLQLR